MAFKKGVSGNPNGRPKGTRNKTTIETKEFLINFMNDNLSTLQSDFDNLESKDRLYFMEKLLKYVIPLKTDQETKVVKNEYEDWTDEQLKAQIDRLQAKDLLG